MKETVRVGFIGCGGIANGKHFPGMAFEKKNGVKMVAFCDLVEERAQQACDQYGDEGAKVYTDYKKLLEDKTIDAVHVLTPNVMHAPITIAALEAGKNVLCEKPMAATAADAKKMIEARDKSGKMLTIGYQYRHFPNNATAKQVVDDGWLGEIYYAEASYIRRRGVPTWGVFADKAQQGGGPLIDIATHALDLTLWLMNNYEPAYAVGTAFEKLGRTLTAETQGQRNGKGEPDAWNPDTYEVEDSAMGFIKMKNGATIYLKSSWALNTAIDPSMSVLCGTKGGLDIEDGVRLNHVVAGRQSITKVGENVPNWIPGFSDNKDAAESKEAAVWVKALKGEGDLFVTADQAYVVTCILDAIYESNRTGKPVYFN